MHGTQIDVGLASASLHFDREIQRTKLGRVRVDAVLLLYLLHILQYVHLINSKLVAHYRRRSDERKRLCRFRYVLSGIKNIYHSCHRVYLMFQVFGKFEFHNYMLPSCVIFATKNFPFSVSVIVWLLPSFPNSTNSCVCAYARSDCGSPIFTVPPLGYHMTSTL